MADLRNAILATLAYYDIFEYPLTLSELHRYLINPARFEKNGEVGDISLEDVLSECGRLAAAQEIGTKDGYYMVSPDRTGIYETRILREKLAAQKWKKLLRIAYWFQIVPFLRGVLASGSMALQNTTPESDFDVLVIAQHERLYTCRVAISLMASLFRARRHRFDMVAPNKFCFNHYITDAHLAIEHESLYNAQMYVNLCPVLVRGDVFTEFYRENLWLNRFVYNFKPEPDRMRRSIAPFRALSFIAQLLERVLSTQIGNGVEGILRWYQQRRIKGNAVTYAPGGRTLFDDVQLEFHPHSAERAVLDRYNFMIKELGTFWNYTELDSGLREA